MVVTTLYRFPKKKKGKKRGLDGKKEQANAYFVPVTAGQLPL